MLFLNIIPNKIVQTRRSRFLTMRRDLLVQQLAVTVAAFGDMGKREEKLACSPLCYVIKDGAPT